MKFPISFSNKSTPAPLYGKGRLIREIVEYRLALLLLIQWNVFDAT